MGKIIITIFFILGFIIFSLVKFAGKGLKNAYKSVNSESENFRQRLPALERDEFNYPLKSSSIKLTTKRILRDFTIALNSFVQENSNMSPERVLQDTDFHNRLILQDWKGRKIGGSGPIISKVHDRYKENPYALLFNIVWSMVSFELNYDPTIGSEKDRKEVFDLVEDYILEVQNSIKTTDQKHKKSDQEHREQAERLKDQDGFTLKERQEWKQLLKEEGVKLQVENKIVDIITNRLSEQKALISDQYNMIPEKAKDHWSLGYIIGYSGAVLQIKGIDTDATKLRIFTTVLMAIFGEKQGPIYFQKFMDLEMKRDSDLLDGINKGGQDIFTWINSNTDKIPMGWLKYVHGTL